MLRFLLMPGLLLFSSAPWAETEVKIDTAQAQIESYLEHRIVTALNERYFAFSGLEIKIRMAPSIRNFPPCEFAIYSDKHDSNFLGAESWWLECGEKWRAKATTMTKIELDVAKAARHMKKGERIMLDDITMSQTTLSTKAHVFQSAEHLVGSKLRRSIRTQQVFSEKYVELEYQVHRGHQVIITYQSDSFSLETTGIAEEDGVIGDKIRVRNEQSGGLLSVVVIGENRVQVTSR